MKKLNQSSLVLQLLKILLLAVVSSGLVQIACFRGSERTEADKKAARLEPSFETIKNLGLTQEKAYDYLKIITSVGGRLTGSPEAEKAVELAVRLMEEAGADRVWTEPVRVRRWVRGSQETALVRSRKFSEQKLQIAALGNSPGTSEAGLQAKVVEVQSFEELVELKNLVKDRIVFFNVPMDRTLTDSFLAYGRAAQFRVRGASEAARYGARAVLVRSMTFRVDDYPHTGLITYDETLPIIPAVALSTADAERLHTWLQEDPELEIFIKLDCQFLGEITSANVIGELRGQLKPEEVILVGGHLDSWDLGSGAHDDAAGCAVAIEVLRLIKEAGLKPDRTVRAVLFMDEEFGGTGGRAYARHENRKKEKHLVALEQDRGGFVPIGLAIGGGQKMLKKLRTIQPYLQALGIHWIKPGGGGVDVAPLAEQGVITGSLIPDSQKYFDFHHSALDLPEAVHPRELELQAVVLAMVVYFLAQKGV